MPKLSTLELPMLDGHLNRLLMSGRATRFWVLEHVRVVQTLLRYWANRSLDDYTLPARCHLRAVEKGEERVLADDGSVMLVMKETRCFVVELPLDVNVFALYILSNSIDMGGQGRSGMAKLMALGFVDRCGPRLVPSMLA